MTFPYLIAAILVVAGLVVLARWLANADPKLLARHVRRAALILTAVIALALYISGRLGLVIVLATMAALAIMNWRALRARLNATAGPSPGQTSSISTAYLDMLLDHDSGEMTGTVRRGVHEGRELGGMSLEDLLVLRGECTGDDPQSASILEAYLDRRFGSGWRSDDEPAGAPPNGSDGVMTPEEAYRFLGLEPGASPDEIRRAHRRMMKNFHPDHGGSDYIAAKLNEAKSILLNE